MSESVGIFVLVSVCGYVYVHVCINTYACTCNIHMRTYPYTYTHARTHSQTHKHTVSHTHISVSVCTRVCVNVCTYRKARRHFPRKLQSSTPSVHTFSVCGNTAAHTTKHKKMERKKIRTRVQYVRKTNIKTGYRIHQHGSTCTSKNIHKNDNRFRVRERERTPRCQILHHQRTLQLSSRGKSRRCSCSPPPLPRPRPAFQRPHSRGRMRGRETISFTGRYLFCRSCFVNTRLFGHIS